jgi:hypothetical protein
MGIVGPRDMVDHSVWRLTGLGGAPRIREMEESFLPQRLQRDYVTTFGH